VKPISALFILPPIMLALFCSPALAKGDLFSQLFGAELKQSYKRHYDKYSLIVGKNKQQYDRKIVAGKINRSYFEIPNTYSEENILNNYVKAISGKGGKILFVCKGEVECGNAKTIHKLIKPLKTISKNNPHLVVARFTQGQQEVYASIYVYSRSAHNSVQLDIVRITDEPLDLIQLDKRYLTSAPNETKFKALDLNFDEKNSRDHPLISRIPGSRIRKYKHFGFDNNKMVNSIQKKSYGTIEVKGKTTMIGYQVPREYSEFEIIENYVAVLDSAGFRTVLRCFGEKCGKRKIFSTAINSLMSNGFDKNQHYLLTKLERSIGDVWVSVYVIGHSGSLSASLHIVEEKALNNQRLSIDVDSIRNAIEKSGHIALEGLLFKYDSEDLLPESLPVLSQVAAYIKSVPSKQFYVVGHTDDKGARSYNTVLSGNRAKAIIKVLIEKHSIDKNQLASEGVGEYVPVASNSNEVGRRLNRRVELVLRSDKL